MAPIKFKSRLDFVLHVTNYFNGHWEDPDWGRRPTNQALIGLAILDLAAGITDAGLKKQISEAAEKAVAKGVAGK
ncbi:MAG: hypothetical protein ACKVQW_10145 [Pyrinomonadaceae bacterium]